MGERFAGTWHNQYGSELTLSIDGDGKVTGHFRTAVGLARSAGEFELLGYVADDLLVFSVNFGKLGCLTSWVGHHVEDRGDDTVETLWQMTVRVPHPRHADELWKGVWSGHDTFVRGPFTGAPQERRAPWPLWIP